MSEISVNSILDASGGATTTINGFTPTVSNMAGRNKIINGGMVIDQRNAGASVNPSTGAYTLDRWDGGGAHDGVLAFQQVSDAPTGFTNSFRASVSTADASLSATQYARFGQMIEGLNLSDFAWGTANATSITLSFWVKSSLTGTFGGYVTNSAENRWYVFSYVVSSANTWEQKTITLAGDTSGTWLTTNGIGLRMYFSLGAGSTYVGTAGSWGTSVLLAPTGQTNVMGTLNATWQVTGVQLEAGSVATPFEHRMYGQELALCQRYYQKSYNISVVPATVTSAGRICFGAWNNSNGEFFQLRYPVPLRASPTITTYNPDTGSSNSVRRVTNGTNVTGSIQASGENGFTNLNVVLTTGSVYAVQYTASAEL